MKSLEMPSKINDPDSIDIDKVLKQMQQNRENGTGNGNVNVNFKDQNTLRKLIKTEIRLILYPFLTINKFFIKEDE